MTTKFEEHSAPPDAVENGGIEVVRASVVDGAVSIALRRSFDDPFTWGRLLIDLARQAARVYALETDMSEEEAFERIRAGIESQSFEPDGPSGANALN